MTLLPEEYQPETPFLDDEIPAVTKLLLVAGAAAVVGGAAAVGVAAWALDHLIRRSWR